MVSQMFIQQQQLLQHVYKLIIDTLVKINGKNKNNNLKLVRY